MYEFLLTPTIKKSRQFCYRLLKVLNGVRILGSNSFGLMCIPLKCFYRTPLGDCFWIFFSELS